ncbi:ferric reduction oxidase 2-like [Arachis duranensis]|uniref:ferric-chelate reductase (NADH) n=1 Tax=Arachis duranensis TaxID=130453 RepID=A0A6P4BTQ9_ARADU|nr:ferric reduction oxidase 2-like [Arachis duranensis]
MGDQKIVKRSPSQVKYDMILYAIRLVVLVVLLGWIFIWIMMPTSTFRQTWLPHLRAKTTTSTYFGSQGTTLLIYTFPVLFIASLGCIYLHIVKKANDSNMDRCDNKNDAKGGKVTIWKRPFIVKGPLGIVSGTEVAMLLMFIGLLVWSFATYLHNFFALITRKSAAQFGVKVWELKLEDAGLILGLVGNICLAFLFFPVSRASPVLPLLGLTSESCIKYHIWLGHLVLTFFTAHGISYIIFWAATNQISQMVKWEKIGISNVAGEISLVCGLILWIATIPGIRRRFFELFFYAHYLYIFFMIFFIFHVGISYASIMLPGFYIFMVDRFLRFLQSRTHIHLVSARVLPCDTIELNFSKTHELSYTPTSVMFINIPSISKLQWHPFTITSSSKWEPEKLSVVIKSEGTWSKKLYQMLSTPTIDHIDVSVEGPYGPASTNYLRHDSLVMVSGGSGITPFISIIRDLIYLSTTFKYKTPKILLICAFKNTSSFSMLDLILPISGTPFEISNLELQIEAYITRDKEFKSNTLINLQTKWFKPNPNDAPIYAILGPNNWLWFGAIISSSFIIFLILIGIITRYYIFPKDHNTNGIFSYSLKALINMLVMCVSIAIVASVGVLWNKKLSAKKGNNQVQHLEGLSPTVSPSSVVYYNNGGNHNVELESLPSQLIAQATNVHYGERPDLRKILFEIKGSSVGVFASGPKKMRQEVAAICSTGLTENLHFESISFSW